MRVRWRLLLSLLAIIAMLPGLASMVRHFPRFGSHPLPYGDAVAASAPAERHVTNLVTAVNFDYRGLDTIGEEFILLAAVTGTIVLLRGRRGENVSDAPARVRGRVAKPRSLAMVLACRGLAPILLVFGFYVVLHAQLTPGGGFQGGAIIGSGATLIYLGESYRVWRRLIPSVLFDAIEAAGAFAFISVGLASMAFGGKFLENLLPLGEMRSLLSGGFILIENGAVAFAVAGGFVLLLLEFLEETRAPKLDT